MEKEYSAETKKLMEGFQKAEETATITYTHIARRLKNENDRKVMLKIAADEKDHANIWKRYTGKEIKPNRLKILWYIFLSYLMGYTFVIKLLENGEYSDASALKILEKEIPEVSNIIQQEQAHEKKLMNMLDEERLQYVGAMVLGLNDALVELTGTIAGLTFVLSNTLLVAMAGIITGIAATLSMAASNYLAERANNNPNALKASVYTGIAYLITVILLVLPYLLYPPHMCVAALGTMLVIVIFIIFFFNYYISVAKSLPFMRRFLEMACISLSVALIAFGIGLLAKLFLDVDV